MKKVSLLLVIAFFYSVCLSFAGSRDRDVVSVVVKILNFGQFNERIEIDNSDESFFLKNDGGIMLIRVIHNDQQNYYNIFKCSNFRTGIPENVNLGDTVRYKIDLTRDSNKDELNKVLSNVYNIPRSVSRELLEAY